MNKKGLYIHAPFCTYKCPYCDFYSIRFNEEIMKRYTDALIREIEKWGKQSKDTINTLYFGGGTPTLMNKKIPAIIEKIRKNFSCELEEVTVEANPKENLSEIFKSYKAAGVDRISLGAQSANENELKRLGRRHSKYDIAKSVESAVNAGISNISLDIMTGIPDQTESSLRNTIDFYNSLNVSHISGYILKLEKGTPYFKMKDKLNLPGDDETADLYFMMVDYLEKSGFAQYEISNFSKPGFESKHNLKYWHAEEYIGIGPSAYGFINGERYHYSSDIEEFIKNPSVISDGKGGDDFEKIMLGLRLTAGISLSDFSCKSILINNLKKIPDNYFRLENGILSLTKEGFAVSNSIISTLTEDM